ncbi:MAG: hypothetical protein ABI418_09210, partial [Jatrophihabitantaceae bacterium]
GLTLEAAANPDGISDYQLLDVGFRYGLGDPTDPLLLSSLDYPLYRGLAGAPVPMSISYDPVSALDPDRTRLSYLSPAVAMDTHYLSQLGYPVSLTPNAQAGLAFHRTPRSRTEIAEDDPLYLSPIGDYSMTVTVPPDAADSPAARLTGGISGSEYFGFSSGSAIPVSYTASQPAFAPDFPTGLAAQAEQARAGLDPPAAESGQLTDVATAAYAAIGPPTGGQAWYFAQPAGGAFFHIRAASSAADSGDADLIPYLVLLELISADVDAPASSYPLVPYSGASGNDLSLVQALESQILSPLRRAALGVPAGQLYRGSRHIAEADPPSQAITPQGVLADITEASISSITLAPARSGSTLPQLAINQPSATFRSALLSNQLFLVAANPVEFMANADFNYWITDAVLGDLARLTGAETVPPDVISLLASQARTPQTSLADFTAMLDGVLTGANAQYRAVVTKYSVYFELDVEGWRFRLSPTLWAGQPHPPVLIFKYATASLYDFVQNTDSWAWPAVATLAGSVQTTQALINGILDSAITTVAEQGSSSNLYNFVTDIVLNPSWTGVLMLNANVPFSSVPPELAGLATGIKADEFRAHHVGISITPVSIDEPNRSLAQGDSAIFGLIDYEQLDDIAHIVGDFDFKVLLLQVLFANSAVATFAGRIELFINRLFGELVTLFNSVHYNNILLDGTYQRHGSSGHYVFATGTVSVFGTDNAGKGGSTNQVVLLQTEFDQAQFVTATVNTVADSTIHNRFLLSGKLRFAGLRGFDAFSFGPTLDADGAPIADGYLAFAGVSVDLDAPVNDPDNRTFRFNLDEISFDPAASTARPTSFFQRFPLQISGLIGGDAKQLPRDLGYLPLATPLSQPGFTGQWYGLVFAVDLGTLGALSSAPALSAAILAAWSPTGQQHLVNIGLKMPGIESARALLPIEGVLDLGFASIDLQADGATSNPPDPAYVLRFRDFYLRFLGWKFPPGQNTIALFGNPDSTSRSIASDRGALGWYAAYAKQEKE